MHNLADHWYPKDIRKQVNVDQFLEWQHSNTKAHCTQHFKHKVLYC